MNLFSMQDGVLAVSPEALGIKIFNDIWKRDKSKSKNKAREEFYFIYFFADYKSDFADIIDEQERKTAIIESVMENPNWEPDDLIYNAIEFYRERSSTVTSVLLDDAKSAVYRISSFLKTVDLDERDVKSGKPIHNPKNITGMVGDMSSIVENISKLERKVKREIEEENTMKGGREKNIFEDGII